MEERAVPPRCPYNRSEQTHTHTHTRSRFALTDYCNLAPQLPPPQIRRSCVALRKKRSWSSLPRGASRDGASSAMTTVSLSSWPMSQTASSSQTTTTVTWPTRGPSGRSSSTSGCSCTPLSMTSKSGWISVRQIDNMRDLGVVMSVIFIVQT